MGVLSLTVNKVKVESRLLLRRNPDSVHRGVVQSGSVTSAEVLIDVFYELYPSPGLNGSCSCSCAHQSR